MVSRRYRRLLQRRLRRRPLLPFLLAATVAVDVAVVASRQDFMGAQTYWGLIVLGMVIGQVGLLGVWVASAWQGIVLRLGIAVLASQIIAIVLANPLHKFQLEGFPFASAFLLSLLAGTIVTMIALEFFVGCFKQRRPRFSIAYSVGTLLLLTTVVAIVASLSKQGDWSFFLNQTIVARLSIVAIVPAALWFACKQSRLWCTAISVVVTPVLASFLSCWLAPVFQYGMLDIASFYIGTTTIILIWLLALRSRRTSPLPFQLRLLSADEEAAPENPERPLERHQAAELKEINVVV